MRLPSEIKFLPNDPVCSNWVKFNKKVSIINCFTNSKSFRAIYFFFEFHKLKVFEKTSQFLFQFPFVHYSFPTVSWLCFFL